MDQAYTLSLFQGVGDTHPEQVQRTWAQLCAKFAAPIVRREKDGLLFSPARYRRPRRLIANVVELSLLVLEVDGAWRCDDCGHQGPLVMFRNRRHEGDRCPACKKRDRKLERSNVTQIRFGLRELAAACRRAFPSAFALYSTHGHCRETETNPLAEPRFRIVLPLTKPVPATEFLELWYAAVDALTEVPADPQVKDPNRIYYTPVKFSDDAPYEFHLEPGQPLDWKLFLMSPNAAATPAEEATDHRAATNEGAGKSTAPNLFSTEQRALNAKEAVGPSGPGTPDEAVSKATASAPSTVSSDDIYSSHEARHAELCRRIAARGKLNSRGNYDARCLAHGGKGCTALFYNPRSGAVSCNRECPYDELLVAEGLRPGYLPPKSVADVWARTANAPRTPDAAAVTPSRTVAAKLPSGVAVHSDQPLITLARLHTINALLLAHLLELTPEDETSVRRHWGEPFSEAIEWPGTDEQRRIKICSFPSRRTQLEAVKKLSREFNLEGVPGFYRLPSYAVELPGPDGVARRAELAEFGPFRLSLDQYRMKPGALVGPYDNGSGYICGLRIWRNVRDKVPFLLTSRDLPGGAKAVSYREESAA
jgi:hypothetical protein